MRRRFGPVVLSLASVMCLASAAQAETGPEVTDHPVTCDTLQAAKARVYGFHLTQLNEAQIEAKTREMDEFWKQAEAAGPAGITCLRELLQQEKTDHYFQFDAATWLFPRDKSAEALLLIRDAIAPADFQEIDPANYLSLALELSHSGVDVSPLAARLLRFPNAVIQIPEHALSLDSDTAALFLYGSMSPALADKSLATELEAPEPFVRDAAAHLLAEQMTRESFRALSHWDGAEKIQEEFRRNDIQAVMKYQTPAGSAAEPKFTRAQVLAAVAGLPHTQLEIDEVMKTRGAEFDKRMRETKATPEQLAKAVAEGEPIYGLAEHTAFIGSAIRTLGPEDFDSVREARRRSLTTVSDESLQEYLAFTQIMIGMLNRLDLFREFREH